MFATTGFDETTVDQISAAAGVSRRTFFRYFDSKAAVLWSSFDLEIDAIRSQLAGMPDELPIMDAIRLAVATANHYHPDDVAELRTRMNLIGTVPALQASSAIHYARWEEVIADFVAERLDRPANSLYPLAVSRATLAVCRAAFDRWVARADADLHVYLDLAIGALAVGFDPARLAIEPRPRAQAKKRS